MSIVTEFSFSHLREHHEHELELAAERARIARERAVPTQRHRGRQHLLSGGAAALRSLLAPTHRTSAPRAVSECSRHAVHG
ncbi:hypothetical protein [Schumannella soli]|uniref:Uncharacterized protein n=1 Tax=Schumannella soli TaxID=2590779 RepID=A0A506XSK8_9MICO|nr:hypothetical protein [Schumannella soli]TPW75641.1 hypothetical protein FJ657_07095 [Schumannella soli]